MRRPLADRFWEKVDRDGPDGCWVWTGANNGAGYGQIRIDDRNRYAHRVAYELEVGPIPESLFIDHLCRNRGCVNPAHLEPVTNAENILRGTAPTAVNARKKACPKGHPYRVAPSGLG